MGSFIISRFWLLSPFKCLFNPEMDHIYKLGQIWNFCSAMLWWPFWFIIVHFGLFWCISWVTPPPLHDWFWLRPPFKGPFNPEMGYIRDSGQIRNIFALPYYAENLDQFWSILVLFGAPHGWPHHPFMTCSDSFSLSCVHLIQKWIILVTQDKFETLLFG